MTPPGLAAASGPRALSDMKLLLDQSFPRHAEEYGSLDFALIRWVGEQVTDDELLRSAAAEGMSGVIFLGLQALADGRLARLAADLGLFLGATHDLEPMEALRALTTHIHGLQRAVAPGAVCHLYVSGIRPSIVAGSAPVRRGSR